MKRLISFSIDHPLMVYGIAIVLTVLAVVQFPRIRIDTDPENMLPFDEPVRVKHRETKSLFSLYDMIVVGIVDDDPDGVFRPETLKRIAKVTDEILGIDGVIARDLISPTTTDDIQVKDGVLNIDKLLINLPKSSKEAEEIRDAALDNPILKNMLVSGDGKAIALYIPIESKDKSYRISQEIRRIIDRYGGKERYYITGLPVAEDTFGVEMFKEMAISAPLAGLVILALMYLLFRSLVLILSPMIVAILTVVWTMGLLIGIGFTVHIMSSMIPIFLMPISVVDSIHILSDFYERYSKEKRQIMLEVMSELFKPMLFTSITTATGFASLALTPIPPVQIFGLFVAVGVLIAWLLTITLIPAYVALVPERFLKGFGRASGRIGPVDRIIRGYGHLVLRYRGPIVYATILLFAISIFGISRININDNPVRWFKEGHPIRIADRVLNSHFGGSYMAYLVIDGLEADAMKDPKMMGYIDALQRYLEGMDVVGKTTSVADVVRKIGYELHDEEKAYNRVPDGRDTIAQYLFLYEMSGDPQDLYHLVDYDYRRANIWIQLKSGDNRDMTAVEEAVRRYMANNPPPRQVRTNWAGLTYINVVWQEKMVWGMVRSLLGSFVVVLVLMVILFRSFLLGLISMVPLSLTIAFIYGLIGLVGKDYDMPVAVLSALTLGLAIDFAIHLIQRTRQILKRRGDWRGTMEEVFNEPVKAILKNMVIISIGFTPLFIAPLVPYQTVGFFMVSIMALSGMTTLTILPGLLTYLRRRLMKEV